MVDDHNSVIVAERPGETNDPAGGCGNGRAARRRQRHPARANAARADRAKAVSDRGGGGKCISERRLGQRAFAGDWARRCRRQPAQAAGRASGIAPAVGLGGAANARRPRPPPSATSPALSASPPASSACCWAPLLELRETLRAVEPVPGGLPSILRRPATAACSEALSLARAPPTARRYGLGSPARCGEQYAHFDQFVGAAAIGKREQAAGGGAMTASPASSDAAGCCSRASRSRCAAT